MRLLLLTDAVGGVWVYSLELAHALRSLGIEIVLAAMGPSPTPRQRSEAREFKLIDTGLPLDWMDTGPSEMTRAAKTIGELAKREAVDVVQTSSAALLGAAAIEQPCVAVQHSCLASWWAAVKRGPLPSDFEWRRELVRQGLRRAAAIVAPTHAFAEETRRIYGLREPAIAIHNGRSPDQASEVALGRFVLVAGRLWDEGKNVATLDAAVARVRAPFVAAGAARGPNGAVARIEHMKILGEIGPDQLSALRSGRPVFASAALYEPFGLSALEAGQAGCALVLSDIATHREIWDGAAIFVPARDEQAFAAAIQDLLDDNDKRAQLGRRAHARARHFTPDRMARRMADVYSSVVKSRAESAQPEMAITA